MRITALVIKGRWRSIDSTTKVGSYGKRIFFSICTVLYFSNVGFSQDDWAVELLDLGTFSSPRVSDLNQDGVKDIVLGAGRLEFQASDSAVIAIDGVTGKLLWTVGASDQMFGSPVFQDITDDGVEDVFIGGRSAEFLAIDGASGEVIWRFLSSNEQSISKWFNFYNPQFIDDQNSDGLSDLLVSNGGDVYAEPYESNRPVGHLVIINSKTGELLSQAEMPDGKETYLSPIVILKENEERTDIIFGTGGETIGGNLYVGALRDLQNGSLSNSKILDSSKDKGYIGPPVIVDITKDGVNDVIVNSVDGRLMAFDGRNYNLIWEASIPNTESYNSCAVGHFNQDDVKDIFVSYGRGTWPRLEWSVQMMIDGASGNIEFIDSLGFYQNSTPLAIDLTGDGIDEAVMSINFQEITESGEKLFYSTLMIVEFLTGEVVQIAEKYDGSNLSSTPWIGDLDDNGFVDIIFCHSTSVKHTYDFSGMSIHRLDTQIPVYGTIQSGAYQGSDYDGTYDTDK